MGGAQAAKVMDIVNRAKVERMGMEANERGAQGHVRRACACGWTKESRPSLARPDLWDDGIIDPRDTRRILGLCLALAAEAD